MFKLNPTLGIGRIFRKILLLQPRRVKLCYALTLLLCFQNELSSLYIGPQYELPRYVTLRYHHINPRA